MMPPRISVQLSKHDDALLRSIANERGHSVSFIANEMIRKSLHEKVFMEELQNHLEPIHHRMIAIEKFMCILLSNIYPDQTECDELLSEITKRE